MDQNARIGAPILRKEDRRFLTGAARYTDDLRLEGEVAGVVLRSPHAHARITRIDTAAAAASPGVLGVYTGEDIKAAGLGTIRCQFTTEQVDGSPMITPPRPLLADAVVRHVGEPVAFIVAETLAAARDAAERIDVDYQPLPAIVDGRSAADPGTPEIWSQAPHNTCFVWDRGDAEATARAIATADRVLELELVNNRLICNAIETRNAIGHAEGDRLTLYSGTQGVHLIKRQLADEIFGVSPERIRVVTRDVGGAFGTKGFLYPEQALVLFAAREIGRPVRWIGDRSEAFLSDSQGRDHVSQIELALDQQNRFVGLRVKSTVNLGAYLSNWSIVIPTYEFSGIIGGVYTIPAVHVEVRGVFTNTVPVDAYRGAGRPEAMYLMERTVDDAAHTLGVDPLELRRQNFIPSSALPYETAVGITYDSGDFARILDQALAVADQAGFDQRRETDRAQQRHRGFGVAYYIETNGAGATERARVQVDSNATVTLLIGTQSTGQGHETAYAQIVADRLQLPIDRVTVIQGDSDLIEIGTGTSGSRSMPIGGVCCERAAQAVIEKAKRVAATALQTTPAEIEFEDGVFRVGSGESGLTLAEVAAAALDPSQYASDEPPGLEGVGEFGTSVSTNTNGCHICELSIDADTGRAHVERYTVVDDLGTVINPVLLAGQIHGGTVQGIGQALLEHCAYHPETGQLESGSFMDYCVPRADDVPAIDFHYVDDMPCKTNPMGIKGVGEVGSIGAPPAVINAVVDVLHRAGVGRIDMPATAFRIWEALREASG